jgi:two-component system response regulator FlrC
MLSFALEQMRLPYRHIGSGSQVLQDLLTIPVGAHPTLVVLDIDLPGMDGHAILERLAHERPNSFLVLVLSSHADESMQVRSLFAGAIDHLPKPFNVRVLMAKINRYVALSPRVLTH